MLSRLRALIQQKPHKYGLLSVIFRARCSDSCSAECQNCDAAVGVPFRPGNEGLSELESNRFGSAAVDAGTEKYFEFNWTAVFFPLGPPALSRCAPNAADTARLCPSKAEENCVFKLLRLLEYIFLNIHHHRPAGFSFYFINLLNKYSWRTTISFILSLICSPLWAVLGCSRE